MIAVACIIGMVLLTMYFDQMLERQRNPNQMPASRIADQMIEVQLDRNRQGHYVVSGTINGVPVEFLLDTGATDVVIPAALADTLGLTRGRPAAAMTANGMVTVYGTVIDQLSVGEIRLTNIKASINPGMAPPGILLGMSALRQIEFVHRGDSLTLRQWLTD